MVLHFFLASVALEMMLPTFSTKTSLFQSVIVPIWDANLHNFLSSAPNTLSHARSVDYLMAPGNCPVTHREQDWPITMATKRWGSNQVNQRQTVAIPALSLITYTSPGTAPCVMQSWKVWIQMVWVDGQVKFTDSFHMCICDRVRLVFIMNQERVSTSDCVWKLVCQIDMSC